MTVQHDWMRTVLNALFDRDDAAIRTALSSDDARIQLRDDLNQSILDNGTLGTIPPDQYGLNLLHGLLALRTKFDRETANEKLELNLRMRNATSHQEGHR